MKNWSLNNEPQSYSEYAKQFIVELRRSEITENTENKVNVKCSFRPAVEYTVTFEEGIGISCSDITNLPDTKPIGSGSTVYEGQMLEFIATPPEGMVVDKWYINEEESNSDYGWYGEFYVILQPSEITDHTLNITVTFKQQ